VLEACRLGATDARRRASGTSTIDRSVTSTRQRTASLALTAAVLWFASGLGSRAEAGGVVLGTSAGVSGGESFRFVFMTDGTTNAVSSSIAHYNSFVNAQAGGATYAGSVVTWDAIASTSSASAINNVGQTQTPVYLVDGTQITTSTTSTGLWSGSLLHPINEDISGMGVHSGSTGTWTGTNSHGSKSSNPLGDFFGVTIGVSTVTNGNWISNGVWPSDTTSGVFHIFAISQVLTAVPEPSALLMASTAIVAVGACCRRSWRRGQQANREAGEEK
jgi:hypothetical protein